VIGKWVFYGCYSLAAVTIPDSVKEIGDGAFRDCQSLTAVTIPDSVRRVGDNAFFRCSSLAAVTIGNSVMTIGVQAFDGCSSLATVIVSDTLFDTDFNRLNTTPTTNVIRWTDADYRRAGRWRLLRRWARLAPRLAPGARAAMARAAERSYAPGGAGFLAAQENFNDLADLADLAYGQVK